MSKAQTLRKKSRLRKGSLAHRLMVAALVFGIGSVLELTGLASAADPPRSGGKSIFDDDWKSLPAPAEKPAPVVPPVAPAAPRLPPAKQPGVAPAPDPAKPPLVPPLPAKPRAFERMPAPDPASLAAAEKLVRDVYKPDYADHSQTGMMALARALLNEVQQNTQDPPTLFVLLRDARDIAAAAGDAQSAIDAVRGLRDSFQMNAAEEWDMEHGVLMSAIRTLPGFPSAEPPPEYRQAVLLAMAVAESDLAAGIYGPAADLAAMAEQVAQRMHDLSLLERVRARAAVLAGISAEFEKIKEAFNALAAHPDDAAANFAVGRFFTFVINRPITGLPMLAKGSDPGLKSLSAKDLAAPADPLAQLALADAWAAATKAAPPGLFHDGLRNRALFWYAQSIANAKGLTRVGAQKRAIDLRQNSLKHGLLGQYFRGENFGLPLFSRVDARLDFNWNGKPPDGDLLGENFTIRWQGWLKAPTPGNYKLIVVHDDAARIWLDGQLVYEKWQVGGFRETVSVALTGNLQELRIDYAQYGGGSNFGLGWILPRTTKPRAIPNEVLFHDSAPAGPVMYLPPRREFDGSIALTAAYAQVHNAPGARYTQASPDYECIGYWNNALTWLSWDFAAPEGDYDVSIATGCDGNAGSEYFVTVGNIRLSGHKVPDTGGFRNLRTEQLGRVHLTAGAQTLRVVVTNKPHDWVMDLGRVVLTPVKAQ